MVPQPRLRVDRLPDGSEDLEGAEVVLLGEVLAEFHEGPDGGGRRVELGHAVLGHDLPEPVVGGVEGRACNNIYLYKSKLFKNYLSYDYPRI